MAFDDRKEIFGELPEVLQRLVLRQASTCEIPATMNKLDILDEIDHVMLSDEDLVKSSKQIGFNYLADPVYGEFSEDEILTDLRTRLFTFIIPELVKDPNIYERLMNALTKQQLCDILKTIQSGGWY